MSLLAAIIDQWVVTGGLGFWGRLVLLSIYLVAAVIYLVRTGGAAGGAAHQSSLRGPIRIERARPTLKNSLVNFLLFRGQPKRAAAGRVRRH